MLQLEPIILLLIYGAFYLLLNAMTRLSPHIKRVFAIMFWMTLGIYWGLFLGVMDSLAPGLAFLFGIFLIGKYREPEGNWYMPMQQALFVQLTMGALIIDSLAFAQRFELFVIAVVSWYLLFVAWHHFSSQIEDVRLLEGRFKSVLNITMAFFLLFLGQVILESVRTELLGPIYHSGFGLIGSVFYLLGWSWMMGLWPFQTWLADEIECQNSSHLALYLTIRAAVSFWLLRMWLTNFPEITIFHDFLIGLAILGLAWSALLSLMQVHLQRLLAYSLQALWSLIILWTGLLAKGVVIIDWTQVAIVMLVGYAWFIFISSSLFHKAKLLSSYDPIISDGLKPDIDLKNSYRSFFYALATLWTTGLLIGIGAIISAWPLEMWGVVIPLAMILLLSLYAFWRVIVSMIPKFKALASL